jgi:hypothetical protein
MNNLSLGLSLLLSSGFLMSGCGSSSAGNVVPCDGAQIDCDGVCIDPIAPTLSAIQAQIFAPRNCAASDCHDSNFPKAELDLSSAAASGMNLVAINSFQSPNDVRVVASDSGASYLMNKLLGVDMALGTARMPLNPIGGMDFLCEPEINAIRQWIDDGANPAPSN